jgi:hypothetical protein
MTETTSYTVGWIDTTIHDFLSGIEEPSSDMSYALVTCLDSSFDVAAVAARHPELKSLQKQNKLKTVGRGILLKTHYLAALDRRQRLFFGFDEVWFSSRPLSKPKPKQVIITGPNRIEAPQLRRVAEWMQSNAISLGLGDGTGLNFCARLRGVAKLLVTSLNENDLTAAR